MELSPRAVEAAPYAPDSSGIVAPGSTLAVPEIAMFGEWDSPDLGNRAIHAEARRFVEDCGWSARSFQLESLSPVDGNKPAGFGSGCADARAASDGVRPPVRRAARAVRQRVRTLRLLPQLEGVQAISVGGGALMSDDDRDFPQSLVELGRYARALDKPLLCLGCSAEGTWSVAGWRMMREFLEACSVLAVRDGETASRLAATLGAPPPVFGDFCLSRSALVAGGGRLAGRHQLAINVSQLAAPWAGEQERLEDALVAVAKSAGPRVAARGIGLCFFTTGQPDDERAARRVHARVESGGVRLYVPSSLDQLSAFLRTVCVVVATRLHGAALPLAAGVPVVGLGVASRLCNFFSTMNLGRYCYETGSSGGLADWLALVDLGVVALDQRRALERSAVWRVQSDVRERIASLAAARVAR